MRINSLIKKITPQFLINWYHFLLALMGAVFYRFPSKNVKVIGVTGTKGKSSTIRMLTTILEEAGFKIASFSSVTIKIGKDKRKNNLKMTMPGRMKLQKFISKAVSKNCDYVLLEVTSEGIIQYRHKFIDFDGAVFTNLSPEHIEHHGSFENYREAKLKLFRVCQNLHVLNVDDENFEYFYQVPAEKKLGFSLEGKDLEDMEVIKVKEEKIKKYSSEFDIKDTHFRLSLSGRFNIYNALAAVSVGLSEGIDLKTSKKALEKIKRIKGRMEIIQKEPFVVIVDYAHTKDSLEKVYKSALKLKKDKGKVIGVLGSCGGGRDKWKRPLLGKVAEKFSDRLILTNEDPYDEDPEGIIEDIKEGVKNKEKLETEVDRKKAIQKAIEYAKEGDVVVITGKGSESWMCIENGKKIPWGDKKIVKKKLKL